MFFIIGVIGCPYFLRMAVKWINKEEITFRDAFIMILWGFLANVVVGVILSLPINDVAAPETASFILLRFMMLPIFYLIQSGIVAYKLKINFGKACRIVLMMVGGLSLILLCLFVLEFIFATVVSCLGEAWRLVGS